MVDVPLSYEFSEGHFDLQNIGFGHVEKRDTFTYSTMLYEIYQVLGLVWGFWIYLLLSLIYKHIVKKG